MSKPCLGYPSRTAAVLAMRNDGLSNGEIARRIGITSSTVAALVAVASRTGGDERKHVANLVSGTADRRQVQSVDAPTPASLIVVPRLTRDRLRIYARRRDISVDRLVLDLLDAIAEDRLVDAILGEVGDDD